MKAVDIATRNHVSVDDIINVCEELGIPFEDENAELTEKDVFLVEKKIESNIEPTLLTLKDPLLIRVMN